MRLRHLVSGTGEICYYDLNNEGYLCVYVFYADAHGPQVGHVWYEHESISWLACKDDGQPSRVFGDSSSAIRFVLHGT